MVDDHSLKIAIDWGSPHLPSLDKLISDHVCNLLSDAMTCVEQVHEKNTRPGQIGCKLLVKGLSTHLPTLEENLLNMDFGFR